MVERCVHGWVHMHQHMHAAHRDSEYVLRAGMCICIRDECVLVWVLALKCVCVSVLEDVHKGLGEALQCIILLHLLYSSKPANRERHTEEGMLCRHGRYDSRGSAFHSLVVQLPSTHFDVFQITPFFTLIKLFIAFYWTSDYLAFSISCNFFIEI